MQMADKFYWIMDHPKIGLKGVQATIELLPQMVNPENDTVEEDDSLNTKLQWWVTVSKRDAEGDYYDTHFDSLDTGGDTTELAIESLYKKVLNQYGDYDPIVEFNLPDNYEESIKNFNKVGRTM